MTLTIPNPQPPTWVGLDFGSEPRTRPFLCNTCDYVDVTESGDRKFFQILVCKRCAAVKWINEPAPMMGLLTL